MIFNAPQKAQPQQKQQIISIPVAPLDMLPEAVMAFSVHKLSSTYGGPILRLRRDSDNAEQDFYAVGNSVDVQAIITWATGANVYVVTWYDQSGHGNHATQTTATYQPLLNLDNLSVDHDQVDDYLVTPASGQDEISWLYGSRHGCQISRMPIGMNPQIQRLYGLRTSIAFRKVINTEERDTLTALLAALGLGSEQYFVGTTNDTTIYHRIESPNGPYTITFVGANGQVYQAQTDAAGVTTDVGAQGLTAPITMLMPVEMRTDAGITILAYGNYLSGSIPDLSANTALIKITCASNHLTGSIPDLSAFTALQYFSCNDNHLSGSIPDLSANTALQYFYCSINRLTGSIPDLSANTTLQYFYCEENQLSGSIPNLSANTALRNFYCYANQLTDYMGVALPGSLTEIHAAINALAQSAVDNILLHLDAAGATNGTCYLDEGTNSPPSATGLTAKNNLIAKGWVVFTN